MEKERIDKIFDMLPRYYSTLTVKDINGLIRIYAKIRQSNGTFSKRFPVEKELAWLRMHMFMYEINVVYR